MKHITVVSYSPRHLLVTIVSPALRLRVLVAHAPHAATNAQELQDWWTALQVVARSGPLELPFVALFDSNAVVGAPFDEH
eukprot:6111856-Alexandrium_andersonii.AAC.1